jgi:hypothetical protein
VEYNIKTGVTEIRLKFVECINLVQDRGEWRDVVNTVVSIKVS